jgi:hypothetical protein
MTHPIIILFILLQTIVWPIYLGTRMRSGMASVCYLATVVAFAMGYWAK